ncbi:hypothetical protein AVEN_33188-1 [Araneus ventricosus]|uniref:DUF5641 domain-containing protein n=1 Tax=Araneus ventricosus TaxID=182803 RepID=A0A4Y2MB63_ARAVE|nr:hypothetical protein AVEN_33188-1 [Araneus ventricosus]
MKTHLRRTIGAHLFTSEEFLTLVTQVEACLNSRPVVTISKDPNDFSPLTPGHFLIWTALTDVPEPNVIDDKIAPATPWRLIQQLFQHFWRLWSLDYLSQL